MEAKKDQLNDLKQTNTKIQNVLKPTDKPINPHQQQQEAKLYVISI